MSLKGYFLRHFYIYLRQSYPFLSIVILIDLLPLVAVFWLGWSAMDAIYLYFLETIILLGFTMAKMWKAEYILALLNEKAKEIIRNPELAEKKQEEAEPTDSRWNLGLKMPKMPKMTWAKKGFRGLLHSTFLFLNIPFILIQMLVISLISGNGFSLSGFLDYNVGKIELGFMTISLLHVILFMLFIEHAISYTSRYLGDEEYKHTGLINEAFGFSIRILLQQVLLIGLLAMIVSLDAGKSTIIFLILLKTFIDVFSYITNRIWGGLKGKMEGRNFFRRKKKEAIVES